MVIARMLVRGGLLMLTLTAAVTTAKAICRIMRSPSLSDAGPQRTRSEQVRIVRVHGVESVSLS